MYSDSTNWYFQYDANGMRTQRSSGGNVYTYLYNGSQLSRMTYRSNTMWFTYGADGSPLTINLNGTTYYYVTNLQGDVVGIVDSAGVLKVSYLYDAWGKLLETTDNTDNSLGTLNPLRYRGYVYDQETGLYYLHSRYYNPTIGRFINADEYIATGQGFWGNNMFIYCLNNPINFIDKSGGYAEDPGALAGQALAEFLYELFTGEEHPNKQAKEIEAQIVEKQNELIFAGLEAMYGAYMRGYTIHQQAQLKESTAMIDAGTAVYNSIKDSKIVPFVKAGWGVVNIVRGVSLLIAPVPTPADDLLGVRLIQFGLYNTIYNIVQLFKLEET